MLLQIKSSFLHLKLLFNHIIPLLKVQKTRVDSLKTLRIATQMGTKTELVNTRNNTAARTATNIANKKALKLVGSLKFHDNILTELQKDVENVKGGNLRYFSKN